MFNQSFWRYQHAAGLFLVLGFVANLTGVLMFAFSNGILGNLPRATTFVMGERSILALAVVLTMVGFVLLEGYLAATKGGVFARIGASTYFFAAVLVVVAETLGFTLREEQTYGVVVGYIVLAFLAQASIGVALLQSGIVAAWIGWGAILWNLAWLVALPLISPQDLYFPILHHLVPLVIGIALLRKSHDPRAIRDE